jgi:20S proteasome subunit alpha 3
MEAINNAGSTVGIQFEDGVILAGEKRTISKLLEQGRSKEKLFTIDDHLICAVAGVTSDAAILVEKLRNDSQRYTLSYQEPIPVETLVTGLCNLKQSYTQFGGLRPFGVSFLFAGWDHHHGYQLYHTDPSGNYSAWKATAIGLNHQTGQTTLRESWKAGMTEAEGLELVAKVMLKSMDATKPAAENLEIVILTKEGIVHVADDDVNSLVKKQQDLAAARMEE